MDSCLTQEKSSVMSSFPSLVLYSFWQSSCSWRVRFAMNLKGLTYEYKAVNLSKGEQFSAEFEQLNPLHFVPVLVDGSTVVSDSFAILMYLEDKYPQKALLPLDPSLKALNYQVASIISSSIQPLHMSSLLNHIEEKCGTEVRQPWAKFFVEKGFNALEKLLKGYSGKYATGDEIYMADCFLAPQIGIAKKRFDVDMAQFPNLRRIFESYLALPEFQASVPEKQPDAIL